MSDSKGAYIPFRDLLNSRELALVAFCKRLKETVFKKNIQVQMQVEEVIKLIILEVRKSSNHYDELLKIHGMQEVK